MGGQRGTPTERFWRYVSKSDGCWEWTGAKSPQGYGQLRVAGRTINATRLSIQIHTGQVLDRHDYACHHCDNPGCVRPDHLFVGTCSDNFQDMARKHGWPKRPHQPRGSKVKNSRLTEEDVKIIRSSYVPRVVTRAQLAKRFGVSVATINEVVYRRYWRHV